VRRTRADVITGPEPALEGDPCVLGRRRHVIWAGPGCRSLAGVTEPVGIDAFVRGLPKAELHLHLQGAASVPTVLELARRHPSVGVPTDEARLRDFYTFTDFAHFIEVYISVNRLVRTAEDVQALVTGLGRDLARAQVRYAEVTVTPDSHLQSGIAPDAVADALRRGRAEVLAEHAVELSWIFDIPGELGLESGIRTIDWVTRYRPDHSVGFGLGGPEVGVPRAQFGPVFRQARELGLRCVPHAGETTGPQTIRDSIELLGADRIGHGISAAQDAALMSELVDRDIVLEVCPTSNVRTRAVPTIEAHPFPLLRAAGVKVTLNSDDPGMFDTDLNREYLTAHRVFGLDAPALVQLAREAVHASFADQPTRTRLLAEIDAYAAARSRLRSAPGVG
jgi:aminodeoxyfutalosine deaminase